MGAPFQNATVRTGLDAALAVAAAQGLPTGDPRVLSARGNLVVHVAPAAVEAAVWIVAMADVFPERYARLVEPALEAALGSPSSRSTDTPGAVMPP